MKSLNRRPRSSKAPQDRPYQGLLLAANPYNPINYLSNSVLLVVRQQQASVIALQINHPMDDISFIDVVEKMGFDSSGDLLDAAFTEPDQVFYGGGLDTSNIHIIHSLDWRGMNTSVINDQIGVTGDISILAALASSEGPQYYRACMGHWSWDVETLRQQLDTVNNPDIEYKWESAPASLNSVFGYQGGSQWTNTLLASSRQQVASWKI